MNNYYIYILDDIENKYLPLSLLLSNNIELYPKKYDICEVINYDYQDNYYKIKILRNNTILKIYNNNNILTLENAIYLKNIYGNLNYQKSIEILDKATEESLESYWKNIVQECKINSLCNIY